MPKERFAVLGGGMGSLSAVFSLTSQPNWQDRYEITVYQHGWRLGGKGATGRRLDQHGRIEEHGYHTLFGFYENTFALLRDCYKAYDRDLSLPLSQPFAQSREEEEAHPGRYGLHREGRFVMLHRIPVGSWHTFSMHFPQTSDQPGSGTPLPSLWACIEAGLQVLSGCMGYRKGPTAKKAWRSIQKSGLASLLRRWHAGHPLRLMRAWYRLTGSKPGARWMVPLMRRIVRRTWASLGPTVTTDWEAHARWTTVDFMCTVLIGLCEDDVFRRGFSAIDHEEFYEWLTRHATVPEGMTYTLGSIWVQAAYDSSFAYRDGNATAPPTAKKPMVGTPTMGAGTMIRGGWRLMLTYKGSMAWMFQGGTAEVIFSPLYEVLKRRGVRFKFFHRVEDLEVGVDAQGAHISAIRMVQQATAKDPAGYNPLVDVKGVPCWPAEPLLDQLVEGEALTGCNLESHYEDIPGGRHFCLEKGRDYDRVILGISMGGLPRITQALSKRSVAWKAMVEGVKTVRTQAAQLWTNVSLGTLGWGGPGCALNVGLQPLDTLVDMHHLLQREQWGDKPPVSVHYLCSAMADDPAEPTGSAPEYPASQTQKVVDEVQDLLGKIPHVWKNARASEGFAWEVLHGEGDGSERLKNQYFRANIDPTERYVLSVPGSAQLRLGAGESDFYNLVLAGDWTRNGLNVGCLEAAVMGGLLAARAISGSPDYIPGERDWDLGRDDPSPS